jgi:hypothetical protein
MLRPCSPKNDPLSLMKTNIVSSAIPRSSSAATTRPTPSSTASIISARCWIVSSDTRSSRTSRPKSRWISAECFWASTASSIGFAPRGPGP